MKSLKKQEDFDRVFKQGVRLSGRYISAIVRKNVDQSKLGIIVNKQFGNAVLRNRIKRVVREAFKGLVEGGISTMEIVVIPRPAAKKAKPDDLRSEIGYLLAGIGATKA